jgi:hypothetical protein
MEALFGGENALLTLKKSAPELKHKILYHLWTRGSLVGKTSRVGLLHAKCSVNLKQLLDEQVEILKAKMLKAKKKTPKKTKKEKAKKLKSKTNSKPKTNSKSKKK